MLWSGTGPICCCCRTIKPSRPVICCLQYLMHCNTCTVRLTGAGQPLTHSCKAAQLFSTRWDSASMAGSHSMFMGCSIAKQTPPAAGQPCGRDLDTSSTQDTKVVSATASFCRMSRSYAAALCSGLDFCSSPFAAALANALYLPISTCVINAVWQLPRN